MIYHFPKAIENGVTKDEIIETIAHKLSTLDGPPRCRPKVRGRRNCWATPE
ncbi:MAG: hypothetical protein R3E97_02445 [Candidatus Eisenbacteria bacterium]